MEEKQFHNQVYWITFLFSLLVVWVHSFNAELYLGATQAAAGVKRLEWILGEGLGQISVPGFFMVSSYLFYRRFNWSRLLPKWKSRIRSILVPYLIWNFLYYAGYVAATRIPAISGLIGKPPVPVTIMQSVDALVNYAYNPVFWYLYQLILLIALAPVVYPVMKRTLTGAAALGVIAFALWHGWDFPHPAAGPGPFLKPAHGASLRQAPVSRAQTHLGRVRCLVPAVRPPSSHGPGLDET